MDFNKSVYDYGADLLAAWLAVANYHAAKNFPTATSNGTVLLIKIKVHTVDGSYFIEPTDDTRDNYSNLFVAETEKMFSEPNIDI
jgi:hypothetical protein